MKELVLELKKILEPLEDAAESLDGLEVLLREVGWKLDAEQNDWPTIRGALAFIGHIDDLLNVMGVLNNAQTDNEESAAIGHMMQIITALIFELGIVASQPLTAKPFDNTDPDFWNILGEDIFGFLTQRYLHHYHPAFAGLFDFSGILTITEEVADIPFLRRRVNFDRIPRLFYDTSGLMAEEYGWGGEPSEKFLAFSFLTRLGRFARGLGADTTLEVISEDFANNYYTVDSPHRFPVPGLGVNIFQFLKSDTGVGGIWLVAAPIPPALQKSEAPEGIVVFPVVEGTARAQFQLADYLELILQGQFESAGAVKFEIRPSGVGITFDENLGSTVDASVLLRYGDNTPTILIGSRDSSNLQIGDVELEAQVNGTINAPEIAIRLDLNSGKLIIRCDEGDGFLQKLLPPDGIEANFEFGVEWSTTEGLRFSGSASLEVTIPVHLSLYVIKIESIYLSVGFNECGVPIMVGLTGSAELGPISASIKRIGVQSALTFPETGGNLGKANIDIGILPPTGAGLSINAYGLIGGGTLVFEHDNQRYTGSMALKFGDIGITAIGLITTRMPDGSDGFALLVNIGITFNPAIQLSMGFTLSGVGGLIGVNRTMQIDVLRGGIKKGTLDSILFPDPDTVVQNAGKIISDLRAVFPPQEERFVIGPMLKIGWGTPNIIVGEVGVFVELFDPVRIVLLGQVEMALPKPEDAIVKVMIQIIGVLDFDKKELSFQASIDASSLLVFELYGDIALLIGWGTQPQFGMALGGFHPKFTPPAPANIFADLRRLTVNLNYGFVVQLQCTGFLAITPNSLQFGAKISVFIGISDIDLGVYGFMGFDALFIFSPFSFEAGIEAGLSIRVMGMVLAEVYVAFRLSGPTPWNVMGNARVKIIFFDIDVGFSVTWGRNNPGLLNPVNPWPFLLEDLQRAESWGSRMPSSASLVESFAKIEDEVVTSGDVEPVMVPIVVHPAGILEIRQNTAPLEVVLTRFGNAPVQTYDCFRIDKVTTHDDDKLSTRPVKEFFSRGQFEQLRAEQKLSIPSFEKMQAGVFTASSSRVIIQGERESAQLGYESILINPDLTSEMATNADAAVSKWSHARVMCNGNASSRSALRSQGHARFALGDEDMGNAGMVGTLEETYVIVDANTLIESQLDTRVDKPKEAMTRTQADQVLAQHLALHPDEQGQRLVIAEFEMEVAA